MLRFLSAILDLLWREARSIGDILGEQARSRFAYCPRTIRPKSIGDSLRLAATCQRHNDDEQSEFRILHQHGLCRAGKIAQNMPLIGRFT